MPKLFYNPVISIGTKSKFLAIFESDSPGFVTTLCRENIYFTPSGERKFYIRFDTEKQLQDRLKDLEVLIAKYTNVYVPQFNLFQRLTILFCDKYNKEE
jgi:hypothetical protein